MTSPTPQTPEAHAPYQLLAFCARASASPAYYAALRALAADFGAWQALPALAQQHGMTPLLMHHLRAAGVTIPPETRTILQGMVMRDARRTRAYMAASGDILRAFRAAGVPLVVIKGIALGVLVYGDPLLRPLTDLDLAVAPADLHRARALLSELGYAPQNDAQTAFSKIVSDISVQIDLHSGVETPPPAAFWSVSVNDFAGFTHARQPFECAGETGMTLGREALLIFLSRHLARHLLKGSPAQPLRLIWIADLVGYAERFADSLDWAALRRIEPGLTGRLATCAAFSQPGARPPDGIERYYQGWLRRTSADIEQVGAWTFLRDSLFPSAWWLCLYYGWSGARPSLWALRARHWAHLLQFALVRWRRAHE